ncbi:MAG: PKD domain-containing protein [Bacteroidales bacterium]|nr:PKD domain-containing protein [Bacteroidales bacterium]
MKRLTNLWVLLAIACLMVCGCKKDDPVYPRASFTVAVSNYDNYTVLVTDNSQNAVLYEWDWGDGEHSYTYTTTHTYTTTGTYTIRLKVTSSDGYDDYDSQTVTISSGSTPGGGGTPGGGSTTTPTQVKITSLYLYEFPAAPSSGSWDVAGKPDIYFKIMDGNRSVTYYTSSTKEDVSNADCPIYWSNINYTLYNLSATYNISFWDDDNIDDDELMVGCQWTPSSQNNNYATYYNWANSNYNIDFIMYLTWYSSKGEALYTKPAEFKNGEWIVSDEEVGFVLGLDNK